MPELFIDIETVPGQSEAVKAAIRDEMAGEIAELRAPGNYKDPAKIAEYLATEHAKIEASFDERHRKTALSGEKGEVLCVGWAVEDGPVRSMIRTLGESESAFIGLVMEAIDAEYARPQTPCLWIAHNARDFDLRFLFQRCVILGVALGRYIPHDAGPSDPRVYDTMTKWAGWGNRISLDRLCRALDIPGKEEDGIDGSMVYDLALSGEYGRIQRYCEHDVERLRRVYRRMTFSERRNFDAGPLGGGEIYDAEGRN
jgi:hypothetical protein